MLSFLFSFSLYQKQKKICVYFIIFSHEGGELWRDEKNITIISFNIGMMESCCDLCVVVFVYSCEKLMLQLVTSSSLSHQMGLLQLPLPLLLLLQLLLQLLLRPKTRKTRPRPRIDIACQRMLSTLFRLQRHVLSNN